MKTRDELPVPERWEADRVTFHFAPQASGMLASSVLWMAIAAVGGGGVTTGLVGVLGTGAAVVAGEGASIGVGLPAAMFALFAGSIPVAVFAFVGWTRTLGPSRLVVSTADLQLDRHRFDRLDVREVRVRGGRIEVECADGRVVLSRRLIGLDQPRVGDALRRYAISDQDRRRELRAADRAERDLGPLRERAR